MAPATVCVAPSIIRTPPIQQPLQQRHVLQRQVPATQQYHGQQGAQQYNHQNQSQQHQNLHQQHHLQQRQAQQQQRLPRQLQQEQPHVHADQQPDLQQEQGQHQQCREFDDNEAFPVSSVPCAVSLPPRNSGPAAIIVAARAELLSNSASWCSKRFSIEGNACLRDAAMHTPIRPQMNSMYDSLRLPAGFHPLYLPRSGMHLLPEEAQSGTSEASPSARDDPESAPFLSSGVCSLTSSLSGASDMSTVPGDGSTVASALTVSLDSSQDSTVRFSGRSAAGTPFPGDSLSGTTLAKTPTGGKPPQQQQLVRGQQQQLRNQPQLQEQLHGHTLPQLPRRQPVVSAAEQQQLRYSRQQRGGHAPADTESTLPARQLRLPPLGNSAPHPGARFEYGSRNGVGVESASGRPATSRRQRHQLRQQQDQRTQAERQQRVQDLPRHLTHCRCTSETVQHRPQRTDASEADFQASLSSYPCNDLMSTSDTNGADTPSSPLARAGAAAAAENVLSSIEEWSTPRHANSDAALLHHVHRFPESSGSRSSSSLALMPGGDCEAFLNANAGSREVGRAPLPYLYYNLRIGGGAGSATSYTTNDRQATANTGSTFLRLSCVSGTPSVDDRVTRGKGCLPSSTEAAANAVHASSPLSNGAAAAAMPGCPASAKAQPAAVNNRACLLSKKIGFDRCAAAVAQKTPKSAADPATVAATVSAVTSVSEGANGPNAAHRLQRQLAHNVSLQSSLGDAPQEKWHRMPRLTKSQQTVIDPGAHWRGSVLSNGPQMPPNRTKYPTTRVDHWQEQQPTVTLPVSRGQVMPKSPRAPLRSTDIQIPSNVVARTRELTLLSEENSLPPDGARGLEKKSVAAGPAATDDPIPVAICKTHARVVQPESADVLFPASETSSSTVEPVCNAGGADATSPVMSGCAALCEVCTCSRSSDHIGRGRGPGGPHVATGPPSTVAPTCASATTANTIGTARTAQRTDGLEHTWLRLLCESEAVAEEKVRTCRSSAPIPPAVLLRAPEKLEGHVISSTSRDVLRPPFYSLLQEESAFTGGRTAGIDSAATVGRSKDHKPAAGCRADAEQCARKQSQLSASSDAAKSAGNSGNGGAAVSVIETLHLEKLLQSAIYGAVFRANLHTVFRSTRASKKPRQGDEDVPCVSSGLSANPTRRAQTKEHDKCYAHNELPRKGTAPGGPAAAAERSARQQGLSTIGVEEAIGHSGCSRNSFPQPMQSEKNVGDGHCENPSGDARGTIELRSEVVAVKVLSLSLQLNASPSLQEDFLSELKFYPYLKGHDNILVPHRIYVDRAQQLLLLVFPFAEFEDLFEVLKKRKKPFAEAEVQWICKQLLQAVLFLHRRGIAMRDLSLENVLMCRCPETGFAVPKLTDPGQAVIADQEAAAAARAATIMKRCSTASGNNYCRGQQHQGDRKAEAPSERQWCDAPSSERSDSATRGTLTPQTHDDYDPPAVLLAPDKIFGKSFRPPEVYQQCSYNPFKVDSFCMGWMTYYLLTKQQLFQRAAPSDDNWRLLSTKNASDLLLLLGRKNGAVLSVEGLDFVVRLLEDDPQRRMTIYQALTHPFIALSKPRPVLADKLFPEDAATQEQHMARQRRFHVQLLQQKQSLLQLYNMRWRDQTGVCMVAAVEEVSEQHESTAARGNDLSLQSDNASVHCAQTHRGAGIYPVLRGTTPCRAVLHKCAPCHHQQVSHAQLQGPCEELWQDNLWRAPARAYGDSAALRSCGRAPRLENLGPSVTTQSARAYRGDWIERSESQMAELVDKQCVAYEELPSERHAPTLLVQHSTLLRGTPPTPSTPCRCWSASVPPNPQKAPPPCGASAQIPSTSEKQGEEKAYCPEWERQSACGTQPSSDSIQNSEEATTRRKDHLVEFYVQKMRLRTTVVSDASDDRHPHAMDVNRIEERPRAQHCGDFAEQPGYPGCQQLLDGKPTAELSSVSHHQGNPSEKEILGETPGRAGTACQISHTLVARATAQRPLVPVAGLSRAVEQEGVVQLHSKHLFAEDDVFDPGYLGDEHGTQAMPLRTTTRKQANNDRSAVEQRSLQKEAETRTTPLDSVSDAEDTPAVKVDTWTSGGVLGRAAPAAVESSHLLVDSNFITSTGPLNTTSKSEQPGHGPLSLSKTRQDKQTNKWPHTAVERAGSMSTTTDLNPQSVEKGPAGPGAMELRAGAAKTSRNELRCEAKASNNPRKDSGRHQRAKEDPRKAVHSNFSKGRRGPSSSSTETGSTTGEHCGGRSDSDYCVGARSNGSRSTYNRHNVSHEGPQSCVVLPAAAMSHGPAKGGSSGGADGKSASAESV